MNKEICKVTEKITRMEMQHPTLKSNAKIFQNERRERTREDESDLVAVMKSAPFPSTDRRKNSAAIPVPPDLHLDLKAAKIKFYIYFFSCFIVGKQIPIISN